MTNNLPLTQKTRNKWEILILVWIAYFLNQADRQVFNVVLPLIRDDLIIITKISKIVNTFSQKNLN